jgi:AGZA family xanthine/uracil permease-like MFS transporter
MSLIQINGLIGEAQIEVANLSAGFRHEFEALTMLGNGFIVTAMLWASWLVWVIDARFARASLVCLLAALLTLCGAIHSPFPDGRLFWPAAATPSAVYALAAAYALLAVLTLAGDALSPRSAADNEGAPP